MAGVWHIAETYIKVRSQWRYLYRAIKRQVHAMLGFKPADRARLIPGSIKRINMMRKQQAKYVCN